MHQFEATVEAGDDRGFWLRVTIPAAVSDALGTPGKVQVEGKVNGYPFKSTLLPVEGGGHHLMFNRALQSGTKTGAGSVVRVEIGTG